MNIIKIFLILLW